MLFFVPIYNQSPFNQLFPSTRWLSWSRKKNPTFPSFEKRKLREMFNKSLYKTNVKMGLLGIIYNAVNQTAIEG